MAQPLGLSNQSPPLEIFCSRQFPEWLQLEQISLAFTTYQTSRLCLIGVNPQGQLSGFERLFDRAMGLYATTERLFISTKYQLWQLDNALAPGELYNGYDKLYIPRIGYTTGDLDIHDVAVADPPQPPLIRGELEESPLLVEKEKGLQTARLSEPPLSVDKKKGLQQTAGLSEPPLIKGGQGGIVFVSTLLNCLATPSDRHSCTPLWKPQFIGKIVNEDRCHLNGLAMVEGQPGFVTACSRSDVVDGWRDKRRDGGVVIDISSNEIILSGLSMPHSPRFYQGKLWLHNSGAGEFGYIDLQAGKFEPVTFCPGYLRGLAFWKNFAIVGLSKPRNGDKTFSGLSLDDKLIAKDTEPRCGLMVIDLNSGNIINWMRLEGSISELYDVQILPNVKRPMALGFQNDEISQLITLDLANLTPPTPLPSQGRGEKREKKKEESYPPLLPGEGLGERSKIVTPEIESKYHRAFELQNQNQLDQAVAEYQQIVANCNYAPAYHQLGNICLIQEQFDQAIPYYQQTITLNPSHYQAWHNLGVAYQNQGEIQKAIAAFNLALSLKPNYPEALLNAGNTLEELGKIEEAIANFNQAIQLKPDYVQAYINLALALATQNRFEEAIPQIQTALQLQPDSAQAYAALFRCREMICDWENWENELDKLWQQTEAQINRGQATSVGTYEALWKPWTANQHLAIVRTHAQEIARKATANSLNFTHSRSHPDRLRIGYLSNNFYDHPVSHLIQGLFGCHNRKEFEIFAYSFGYDDNSEYRRRIAADCDQFRDFQGRTTQEIAQQIFADRIHILVDLNGYLNDARPQILALRPAPIQVNYLGYTGTMGANFIDYLMGDAIVTPPTEQDVFLEKLVILPHNYLANDGYQKIADIPVTRALHGLPASGFVFCCFNHNIKIEPRIFEVWMKILAAVPGSVLWLLNRVKMAEENLRREAQKRGIDSERLIFAPPLPKAEHLARHRLADLFLDTYYYNAHTTGSDALVAGVPILTCPGKTFASRVGASLLTAVGLPELIVVDFQEYEKLAVELARFPTKVQQLKQKLVGSPTKVQQLKEKLAANKLTFPLFDTPRLARNLEQAYRQMWEIYASGNSPQQIIIEESL